MYCWKHDLKYANWFSFVALPVVSTNERYFPTESLFTVTSECVIAGVPVWITWLWDVERWLCVQFPMVYLVLVRVMHSSGWDSSKALLETWFIRPVSVSLWPLRWGPQSIFLIFEKMKKNKAPLLTLSLLQPSKYKIPVNIFFFMNYILILHQHDFGKIVCDTEDWRNYAENSALHLRNK